MILLLSDSQSAKGFHMNMFRKRAKGRTEENVSSDQQVHFFSLDTPSLREQTEANIAFTSDPWKTPTPSQFLEVKKPLG